MGSAGSHLAGSEPSVSYNGSAATIMHDGSASKPSAPLGARHTVDEPSNPAVMADSSRQATDIIVAPAAAAVCPGVVTRQSQSLFEDSMDQNAILVRFKISSFHYNSSMNYETKNDAKLWDLGA